METKNYFQTTKQENSAQNEQDTAYNLSVLQFYTIFATENIV